MARIHRTIKKSLHDPDNHDGVITHPEPDILESSGPKETPLRTKLVEVIEFQLAISVLKNDVVKVLHSICQQIWKTQQWPQDWKRSVFILIPNKGNAKECPKYRTIALTSHTRKVMLKILQARLQQYVNCEPPDVQTEFR